MTAPPNAAPMRPASRERPPRLRAVIVDDEPLSRRAMRQLLDLRPDVEVVAEYASAIGLETIIGQTDVLFLDIEMPVRSGIDLARTVADVRATATAGGGPPFVVFVTAHDEYALPAFDACAVDYLTKPVAPARLERAIARVHGRLAAAAALAERVARPSAPSAVASDIPPPASPPESLVARIGLRDVILPLAEVTLLTAEGVYTAVHLGGRRHLVRRSLDDLERVLAPADFVRVHRSYLVRRSAIVEARLSTASRRRELVLRSGAVVPVSRRRQAALARVLRA